MFKDKYTRDMENVTPSNKAIETTREKMNDTGKVRIKPLFRTKQVIAAAVCFCVLVSSVLVGMNFLPPSKSDNGKYKEYENPYVKIPVDAKLSGESNSISLTNGINYDEIFLKLEKVKATGYPNFGDLVTDNALAEGAPSKDQNTGTNRPSTGNKDYSDTNNQVSGVQEADIIKTDGNYIYACGRGNQYAVYYDKAVPEGGSTGSSVQNTTGRVFILSAQNGVISPVSVIKIRGNDDKTQYILSEILLYKDTLILIKTGYKVQKSDNSDVKYFSYYNYGNAVTSAEVYNIKDRANPVFVNELYQSGSYNSCRMIENYLYIVTNHFVYNPQKDKPETYIPYCSSYSSDYLVPAGCIYVADEVTAANYTVITGIDVDKPANHISNAAVLGFAGTVYSSLDNIYVAAYRYNNLFNWGIATDGVVTNKGTVDAVAPASSTVTGEAAEPGNAGSGDTKPSDTSASQGQTDPGKAPDYSYGFIQTYETSLTEDDASAAGKPLVATNGSTDIYRFSVKDGVVAYNATGRVDGTLLNQFCMDEYEDNFRIATTVYEFSLVKSTYGDNVNYYYNQSTYYNNVYVLDKDLKTIGTINKMAPNEKIYSVRFDGNIGYVVTFRQTDPLFAIDLSDAKAPKQLSALKIPGFSTYMHPFGQNLLFGFGQDADENGRAKGLKLSMFDVANKADVKETATLKLGNEYAYSEAMYNHKAILVDSQKNLIGFPVQIYDYNSNKAGYAFYKYENGSFKEVGSIYNENGLYNYNGLRGLYIGEYVYIFSENQSVTSYKLSDFSKVSSYTFPLE